MFEGADSLILVTRPEPGATETAARLAALGFRPVLAPVLRIQTLPARLPQAERVTAVLVTSAQALPALPPSFHAVPLFAVGDATAARARQAAFRAVSSAGGDANDLAAGIRTAVAPGATLLLVTGQGFGQAVARSLRDAGYRVVRRCVYRHAPARDLPGAALGALRSGRLQAALFFSAETAARFVALIERAARRDADLHDIVRNSDAVAISPAAAVALEGLPWKRILTAPRPNQDAMLALLQ